MVKIKVAKKILWALSSVGYGHLMRDLAAIDKLCTLSDVEVDILVPPPVDVKKFSSHNVLEKSKQLQSSGVIYNRVLRTKNGESDLIDFIKEEDKYHEHDAKITKEILEKKSYDAIVADEAFWLLSGFARGWLEKKIPFIYISEFVGMKAMIPSDENKEFFDAVNFGFLYTLKNYVDLFIYFGSLNEVPDEKFGIGLPNQREWAKDNCHFNKPIVKDITKFDQSLLRKKLFLPEDKTVILGIISGPAAYHNSKFLNLLESCFEKLQKNNDNMYFVIVDTSDNNFKRDNGLIQYLKYTPNLIEYMYSSDLVITQAGLSKLAELMAMGKKFISIPMDYHFEQEYYCGLRVKAYSHASQILLRDTCSEKLYQEIQNKLKLNDEEITPIDYDDGSELAKTINFMVKLNKGGFP